MSEFSEMCADETENYHESIRFNATVYKVQTLVDGGLRVTLDLPETAVIQAAKLMECKRWEVPLTVIVDKT